jgi:hypothetical protein
VIWYASLRTPRRISQVGNEIDRLMLDKPAMGTARAVEAVAAGRRRHGFRNFNSLEMRPGTSARSLRLTFRAPGSRQIPAAWCAFRRLIVE